MRPTKAKTSPFRFKDLQKRPAFFQIAAYQGLGPAEQMARGERLDGGPCARTITLAYTSGPQVGLYKAKRGSLPLQGQTWNQMSELQKAQTTDTPDCESSKNQSTICYMSCHSGCTK